MAPRGSHFFLILALPLALLAQPSTINLWSDPAKTAPVAEFKETWTERGKNGIVDRSVTFVSTPDLTVYLPLKEKNTGVGIILCPGGGYEHLAIDKEGHDIARWLNTIGIAGLVLKYRLPGSAGMRGAGQDVDKIADAIHVALEDAEASMALARKNAAKWNLKPNNIGI